MEVDELVRQARQACHEFSQPLTVIVGRTEILLMKLSKDDPNYKSIEQIHFQAEKLSSMVKDLRQLFKQFNEE